MTMTMKPNYGPIIKDGLILITVSTLFVTVCNQLFKVFKKTSAADSLVTSVMQNDTAGVKEILSEKEFKINPNGKSSLNEYLLARTERTDDHGRTPMMWVAYSNVRDLKQHEETDAKHTEMAQTLINAGANPNATDTDGWTALMWSSWSGLTGVAGKLISSGADISVADKNSNTALSLAAQRGNVEIIKLLLQQQNAAIIPSLKNAEESAQRGLTQHPDKIADYQKVLSLINSNKSTL